MSDNNSHAVFPVRRLPPAQDSSDRIPPPSQTTLDAEVVAAEVVTSIPASGVRQKLDAVKSHFEQAAAIVQNDVKPRIKQAIQLLVEIDNQQGWQELGYDSIRQLIQSELQPLLNRSVSQIYRRLNAAKVRQEVSHLCDNIDDIPDGQLEVVSKLPSNQWQEAWTEISATAPDGRITSQHVKSVVTRRLAVSNQEPESHQSLQTSSAPNYEFGQLVLIQCEDSAASERCRRYSGCWGTVQHVFESAAVIAVGGDMVRYLFCDLQLIENSSPVLRGVCDRVMSLWRVPNLPQSVRYLLEFYQRQLEFEQVDLVVLEAIENYFGKT